MNPHNLHSADGSFLGFLFQIERVLLWLSEGAEDGRVGIETDDDVVVELKKGGAVETIYEQAKNAQKTRVPFSDQSEDLWKTLAIWIQAVVEKRINVETALFSAVTNKKMTASRLLSRISAAKKTNTEAMKSVIEELKTVASNLSAKNKAFGEVLINCEEALLIEVIDRITVFDGTYHHDQKSLKTKLRTNLSVGDKIPFDYIYNALFGAISSNIIEAWRSGDQAWIKVDSFNNLYNDLVAQYKTKSFFEKATEMLPVSRKDIETNKNKTYVDQLRAIDCDEEELFEAINDYIRAQSEKSRYAKEFEVTEPKFIAYYDDLKENWKRLSRPRFKIKAAGVSSEEIGYQLFYETLAYRGRLNNFEPEQSYTYKGAYHHLSNCTELGWHPDWEKQFKKTSE